MAAIASGESRSQRACADRVSPGGPAPAPPRPLLAQLWLAYSCGYSVLLAIAAGCALIPAAGQLAHHALALSLHVHIHPAPPPTVHAALWLYANNIRATGWPLIPSLLTAARRSPLLRRLIHIAVLASLAANLLPVAAAIGVYRRALIPYLPHLPFELYAITTGPAAWLIASRGTASRRQLALITATLLAALAAAAVLETWAVPHQ